MVESIAGMEDGDFVSVGNTPFEDMLSVGVLLFVEVFLSLTESSHAANIMLNTKQTKMNVICLFKLSTPCSSAISSTARSVYR